MDYEEFKTKLHQTTKLVCCNKKISGSRYRLLIAKYVDVLGRAGIYKMWSEKEISAMSKRTFENLIVEAQIEFTFGISINTATALQQEMLDQGWSS